MPDHNSTNDFFYGFTMDSAHNSVDSTLDANNFLTFNERLTYPNNTIGPTNRVGYLQYIFFSPQVRTNGVNFFVINEGLDPFYFRSVGSSTKYTYPTYITENNLVFNVIPEPSTAGMLAVGAGIAAYMRRKQKKNSKHSGDTGRKI